MVNSRNKGSMACNRPQKSWKPSKKRVVKACSGKRQKIIHFGATGYGHNYSSAARDSFRARHRCSSANDKLTARYWACKNLWSKGGSRKSCPKNRKCKRASPSRSHSPIRKRKSPLLKSRRRSVKKSRKKRKSPLVKLRRRSVKKSAKNRKSSRK